MTIFMTIFMMIFIVILLIIVIYLFIIKREHAPLIGGNITSLAGPVDMLQMPKQLLMDGYRFQNSLFPPVDNDQEITIGNVDQFNDLNPIARQRVGIFKEKAYIEELVEGFESPSVASIAQINAKGAQDVYLYGKKGDPIEDSERPFAMWIAYGPPEKKREINYPNAVFSWGDIIHRYQGQITI